MTENDKDHDTERALFDVEIEVQVPRGEGYSTVLFERLDRAGFNVRRVSRRVTDDDSRAFRKVTERHFGGETTVLDYLSPEPGDDRE